MKKDFGWQKIVYEQFGDDNELFLNTIKEFSNEEYISTAFIQRKMKVSYARARNVLDRLIKARFALEQIGSKPCKIIKRKAEN